MNKPRGGVWLCPRCVFKEDERYLCGSVGRDGICARCGDLAYEVFLGECQDLRPAYLVIGALGFSTCTTLVSARLFIWDVNGYYRELGVDPHATRREIGQAYQHHQGWTSPRLTYVVAQLLDDEVRLAYDLARPGQVFVDRYVMDTVNQRIADDLARHFAEGGDREHTERIALDHLLNRPLQVVDKPTGEGHDGTNFGWGFYLWRSGCSDMGRLARWREHLANAFNERKETRLIAVGFCGASMGDVQVIRDGNLPVVLLNEREQPSVALAQEAADRVDHIPDEGEIDL